VLQFARWLVDVDTADDKKDNDEHQDGADGDIVAEGAAHQGQPADQTGRDGQHTLADKASFHLLPFQCARHQQRRVRF
jgi:hypothetical protein